MPIHGTSANRTDIKSAAGTCFDLLPSCPGPFGSNRFYLSSQSWRYVSYRALACAPCCSSSCAMCRFPTRHAMCRHVPPPTALACTSPPNSSSSFTSCFETHKRERVDTRGTESERPVAVLLEGVLILSHPLEKRRPLNNSAHVEGSENGRSLPFACTLRPSSWQSEGRTSTWPM